MLKNVFLLSLVFFNFSNIVAQIYFEKGYFINNNGKRTQCLIRNLDWKNNPSSFEYKLSESSEIHIGNIGYIREFGINDITKFIRKNAKINRSSDRDATLEFSREVVSKEEELFLRVLVEGKANLYYYEEGDLRRFFYDIDDNPVKQLVYKRFRKSNRLIGENTQYRQELLNNLKCDDLAQDVFAKLKYRAQPLIELFEKYNKCIDPTYVSLKDKRSYTENNNHVKIVKKKVHINRSSDLDATLEFTREALSEEEELLLKVLVEGKAVLYYYEEGNLRRFFYAIDNGPVKQLVYKRFRKSNRVIGENTQYRQELLNNLKCDDLAQGAFAKLKYNTSSLSAIFEKYNSCTDSKYVVSKYRKSKNLIHLSVRSGLNFSRARTENVAGISGQVTNFTAFENKTSFRLGLELELVFPFNNNKWSILLEPTYRNYQSLSEDDNGDSFSRSLEIDYASIEFTIGVRHSFYLNDDSKLFLTGYLLNDMESGSRLIRNIGARSLEVEINPLSNFGIGMGYKLNSKISAEFRLDSPRELFRNSLWTSNFNNISLILGYTIL